MTTRLYVYSPSVADPPPFLQAAVKGSVNVPLFKVDEDRSLGGLMKQAATFGTGGWWMGGQHMVENAGFMGEVQARVPKSAPGVLVSCQKGLRSLRAAEKLVRAGYPTVAWLAGGYDTATKADFDTTNGKDMRYGSSAGVSGLIGWTRVQQEEDRAMGGGVYKFLAYVAAFAVINILSIAWQAYGEYGVTGKLPAGLPKIF